MNVADSAQNNETLARQLWAVGDPVRLRILRMLPSEPNCEAPCNVSKVADAIGLSQPTASHHLRVLRQAGIIENRRMCRDVIYWVRQDEADAVTEALSNVFRGA